MKQPNINFIRHKQSIRRPRNASGFFNYLHSLHLSLFDVVGYHILIIVNLSQGLSIVIQLLGALLSRCSSFVFVFLKTMFAVIIHLPFLFFLFCIRIGGEYISDFTHSIFLKVQGRFKTTSVSIGQGMQITILGLERRTSSFTKSILTVFSPSSYALPRQWHIRLAAFSFMAILIVSPFVVFGSLDTYKEVKHETSVHIENGLQQFLNATNALTSQNSTLASDEFKKSMESFRNAQETLQTLGSHTLFFARLIPLAGKKIQDAESLISAGEEFSNAGVDIASTVRFISQPDSFSPEKISASLAYLQNEIDEISVRLENGYKNLILIDISSVPQEYQSKFEDIKKSIAMFTETLQTIRPLVSALPSLLGVPQDRRYLIVLQNDSEIRPSGGFMGSFALVDVKKGRVKKIEIPGGGTYELKGQLRQLLVSPWPLHLINARWEFQDSNWFADFPTSARKIKWFYENANGPTVDGVIAINASLAERVLALTGPIYLPAFKKTVEKGNFFEITERAVELEYNRKENKPKKFLGELVERVIERLSKQEGVQQNQIASLFIDAFLGKEIQVYSTDPSIQQIIAASGFSGELRNTQSDYLMIVDANIGGRKTDRVMNANASYSVHVNPDGTLDATLSMSRTHNGQKGDYFTGAKNINYVRVYVPQGSTLLFAKGFSPPPPQEFENPPEGALQDEDLTRIEGHFTVDEKTGMISNHEFDKTVFSNWTQTDVGETSLSEITYRLPFRFSENSPYSLYIQRQSGSAFKTFNFSFKEFSKQLNPFIHDEFIEQTHGAK